MGSEEHQGRWPVIGQSDVADFCRELCESIVGLERAFEAGELSSKLTSGCFEQVLGPLLYETYGKVADNAPEPLHHLRVDAVRALLVQLQNDLVPTQVAHAEVRMSPEGDLSAAELGTDARPRSRFKLVDASFDGDSSTTLRFDQMLDARFWRIGFTFETLDLCDAFANRVGRGGCVSRRQSSQPSHLVPSARCSRTRYTSFALRPFTGLVALAWNRPCGDGRFARTCLASRSGKRTFHPAALDRRWCCRDTPAGKPARAAHAPGLMGEAVLAEASGLG